ncbi:hypothetical protein PG984_015575 [Apiospora sp. TS-2023a]
MPNPNEPVPIVLPNGHTAVGTAGANGESLIILDGSNTITAPTALSTPVTLTTLGETFTFPPQTSARGGDGDAYQPVTTTLPNGHTVVGSKGPNGKAVFVDGSDTITIPATSPTPITMANNGETLVLSPPSGTDSDSDMTITLPDGHVVVGKKGPNGEPLVVLDGSGTIAVPTGASTPVTLTTLGETFTFVPLSATSTRDISAITAVTMISYTNSGDRTGQGTSRASQTDPANQPKGGVKDGPGNAGATGTATMPDKSAGCMIDLGHVFTKAMVVSVTMLIYQCMAI